MVNDSYFRFDDDNKIKFTFSRSSQENWVSWRHTAPYSEYKDNWENCLNLRHTLGIIYLTSILVVCDVNINRRIPVLACQLYSVNNKCLIAIFSCDRTALRTRPSICPSVRLFDVSHFTQCPSHRIIMQFSLVITISRRDVHAKG